MGLQHIYNAEGFRLAAKRKLPRVVFGYAENSVLDQRTYRDNVDDWAKVKLLARAFTGINDFSPRTEIFGVPLSFPMMISPMGVHTIYHPESDVALARAAQKHESVFMHSGVSGVSIEETASVMDPERLWAQIWWRFHDGWDVDYFARLKNLGVKTLIVNGENFFGSKRERDWENGLAQLPPTMNLRNIVNFATHPAWVLRFVTGRKITFADHLIDGRRMTMREIPGWEDALDEQQGGWEDLERFRELWKGNLVIKGLQNPADVARAVELGVDGIHLSNLGGRHNDSQTSTVSALEGVVAATRGAGRRVYVWVDGGVRRGADAVTALALGADAVSLGRPWCYALGSYGYEGVDKLFDIFKAEYFTAQRQVGARTPADIGSHVIARNDLPVPREAVTAPEPSRDAAAPAKTGGAHA